MDVRQRILKRILLRRSAGKSRNGWEHKGRKDAAKLFNTKNWRAAARHRSGVRNQGRKWSGNELKSHKRRRRRRRRD